MDTLIKNTFGENLDTCNTENCGTKHLVACGSHYLYKGYHIVITGDVLRMVNIVRATLKQYTFAYEDVSLENALSKLKQQIDDSQST